MDVARGFVASKAAGDVGSAVGSAKGSLKSAVFGREGAVPHHSRKHESSPVRVARSPLLGLGEPAFRAADGPSGEASDAALEVFAA